MLIASAILVAACDTEKPQYLAIDSASVSSAPIRAEAQEGNLADAAYVGVSTKGGVAGRTLAAQRSRPVASPVATPPTQTTPQVATPGMVIRDGYVTVQIDSLERAIERVRAIATSLGGYVGDVVMNTGEYQVRSATLQLKVPAAKFDDAMAGMAPLGKVERSSSTAQDVGEEFVDVSARVANARRLETRLVDLLARRTGKLEDVLAVERELARVREEIERYEGRIRYLTTRVATSTIMVTVHEKAPIIAGQPGPNPIAAAFRNMWRNFVGLVVWGIEMLGVVIPVAAIAGIGFVTWRRWRRRGVVATTTIGA